MLLKSFQVGTMVVFVFFSALPVCAMDVGMLRAMAEIARNTKAAGDIKEAIASCDMAIIVDPNFAEAYAIRAEFKLKVNDVAGAREDAQKAIDLAPDAPEIHTAYYVKSILAMYHDFDHQAGLEAISKAITLKDNDPGYYAMRAYVYDMLGQTDLANADDAKSKSLSGY